MLVTLNQILPQASNSKGAVPCCNVFGFEDAKAIINAAQILNLPVILATNKDMVEQLGVKALAGMLLPMIEQSSVPVCLHLDHCYDEKVVYQAMHAGYSSVMFDGSQLSLAENIQRTKQVVEVANALNISVEGEIGSVPYEEGRDHIKSIYTEPEEAAQYAVESGLDCLAVAVGNIHRLSTPSSTIDFARLQKIEALVDVPLVIHGTSGIAEQDLIKLKQTRVAKFNVGTSLRQAVGHNLRALMQAEPEQYDRQYFMHKVSPFIEAEALRILKLLAA
jgi:fructose-bisphosphate aldolase class II